MSATENIMVSVIVIMAFLVIGIVIYSETAKYIITEYQLEKQEHLHDLYSNDLNAILLVTENASKRSMADLLSDALYYQEEVLEFNGQEINVTSEIAVLLDKIYGEDGYYLEIRPRIIDVSLNFVIDGSNSLSAERATLGKELPRLLEAVKKKIYVTGEEVVVAKIYILGDKTNADDKDKCDAFDTTRPDIVCKVIGASELYPKEMDSMDVEFDAYDKEAYKYDYNISAPYPNATYVRSIRKQGEKDYYEADWGSGVSYASSAAKGTAKLVIIFPMGDELSTSSIAEECFHINKVSQQKVCDLCTVSCSSADTPTSLRSMETVEKAAIVAKDNQHVVNPIFAYTCDYEYKPLFNTYYELEQGVATENCCGLTSCGGCNVNEGVCFHPECKDKILEQMEYLAGETKGKIIDLKDIDQLSYNVEGVIDQNIDEYKISIGKQREVLQRHAIRRALPLPNKLMTDAKLEVYEVET